MAQQHEQVLENLNTLANILEQRRAQDEEVAQLLRNLRQQIENMAQGAADGTYQ